MSGRGDASFEKGLALAAARAVDYSSNAEDVRAFFVRYGLAAEIAERLEGVEKTREFFTKHVGDRVARVAGDGEVLDALAVVAARLRELYDRAEQYEWVMDLLGWRFDRQEQEMKYAEPGRPGPKTKLVSMSVEALFQRMVAEGWPESNTVEARAHIRQQLTDRGFAPDLLTDAIIENAIGNRVLNPDHVRHPKRKS
jgi:hypothetical protein